MLVAGELHEDADDLTLHLSALRSFNSLWNASAPNKGSVWQF